MDIGVFHNLPPMMGDGTLPQKNYFAFDIIKKMRYILCVVALLEACDVTNKDCHLGHHLGFYQELEIKLKW